MPRPRLSFSKKPSGADVNNNMTMHNYSNDHFSSATVISKYDANTAAVLSPEAAELLTTKVQHDLSEGGVPVVGFNNDPIMKNEYDVASSQIKKKLQNTDWREIVQNNQPTGSNSQSNSLNSQGLSIIDQNTRYCTEWVLNDNRIRRFTRGYNCDIEKATKGITKAATDRTINDLWGLHQKPISQGLQSALAAGAFYSKGYSKLGHQLVYLRTRNIDCRLTEQDRIKACIMCLDSVEAKINKMLEYREQDKFQGVNLNGVNITTSSSSNQNLQLGDQIPSNITIPMHPLIPTTGTTQSTISKGVPANLARKWILCLDFSGEMKHGKPSMAFGKSITMLALSCYPERMYKAFLIDAGFLPNMIFSAIKPFLGERTVKKINFVNRAKKKSLEESMKSVIEACGRTDLDCEYGGENKWLFDPGNCLDLVVHSQPFKEADSNGSKEKTEALAGTESDDINTNNANPNVNDTDDQNIGNNITSGSKGRSSIKLAGKWLKKKVAGSSSKSTSKDRGSSDGQGRDNNGSKTSQNLNDNSQNFSATGQTNQQALVTSTLTVDSAISRNSSKEQASITPGTPTLQLINTTTGGGSGLTQPQQSSPRPSQTQSGGNTPRGMPVQHQISASDIDQPQQGDLSDLRSKVDNIKRAISGASGQNQLQPGHNLNNQTSSRTSSKNTGPIIGSGDGSNQNLNVTSLNQLNILFQDPNNNNLNDAEGSKSDGEFSAASFHTVTSKQMADIGPTSGDFSTGNLGAFSNVVVQNNSTDTTEGQQSLSVPPNTNTITKTESTITTLSQSQESVKNLQHQHHVLQSHGPNSVIELKGPGHLLVNTDSSSTDHHYHPITTATGGIHLETGYGHKHQLDHISALEKVGLGVNTNYVADGDDKQSDNINNLIPETIPEEDDDNKGQKNSLSKLNLKNESANSTVASGYSGSDTENYINNLNNSNSNDESNGYNQDKYNNNMNHLRSTAPTTATSTSNLKLQKSMSRSTTKCFGGCIGAVKDRFSSTNSSSPGVAFDNDYKRSEIGKFSGTGNRGTNSSTVYV